MNHQNVAAIESEANYQLPNTLSLAPASFPPSISAGKRHNVLEAHALQRLRGQGGASTATAIADDWLVFVGGDGVDFVFELPAGQRLRSGNGALRDLVGLADVNESEILVVAQFEFTLSHYRNSAAIAASV